MKQRDTLQEDLIRIYGLDIFGLSDSQMNLLPGHPGDRSVMGDLEQLDISERGDLVPFLLVWLKDMSQPVAASVRDYLLVAPDLLVSEIETILASGEDEGWSARLVEELVVNMPEEQRLLLWEQLDEIVEYSDRGRKGEGARLVKAAKVALASMPKP